MMYPQNSRYPENLELFYNTVPCGLLIYEPEGKILHANECLLTWLGTSLEETLSGTFVDLLATGGKFYYQLFVQPSLKMHKKILEINLSIHGKLDSFPALFSAVVIKDPYGSENVHAAIYKVTDRKKYESELLRRKLNADAEKQLKTEALREVAFDQAHLVRAPLANMLGIMDLIEQMEMSEELRDMIALLRKSSDQLDGQVKAIVMKTNL